MKPGNWCLDTGTSSVCRIWLLADWDSFTLTAPSGMVSVSSCVLTVSWSAEAASGNWGARTQGQFTAQDMARRKLRFVGINDAPKWRVCHLLSLQPVDKQGQGGGSGMWKTLLETGTALMLIRPGTGWNMSLVRNICIYVYKLTIDVQLIKSWSQGSSFFSSQLYLK